MAKRKARERVPFHTYISTKVEKFLKARRRWTDKRLIDAVQIADMIRSCDCPKNLDVVNAQFKVLVDHIGGIRNNSRLSRAERSVFYGAQDALREQMRAAKTAALAGSAPVAAIGHEAGLPAAGAPAAPSPAAPRKPHDLVRLDTGC